MYSDSSENFLSVNFIAALPIPGFNRKGNSCIARFQIDS